MEWPSGGCVVAVVARVVVCQAACHLSTWPISVHQICCHFYYNPPTFNNKYDINVIFIIVMITQGFPSDITPSYS